MGLIDDVNAAFTPHDAVVAMPAAQGFQRITDFHGWVPLLGGCLRMRWRLVNDGRGKRPKRLAAAPDAVPLDPAIYPEVEASAGARALSHRQALRRERRTGVPDRRSAL